MLGNRNIMRTQVKGEREKINKDKQSKVRANYIWR